MSCNLTKVESRCCCGYTIKNCYYKQINECPEPKDTPNGILRNQIDYLIKQNYTQ